MIQYRYLTAHLANTDTDTDTVINNSINTFYNRNKNFERYYLSTRQNDIFGTKVGEGTMIKIYHYQRRFID